MAPYKHILKSIILPIGDKLTGGHYLKYIKLWKHYDSLSESELQKIQENALQSTLVNAQKHVPFYSNIELNPDLSCYENLSKFPILTKDVLRHDIDLLISNTYRKNKLNINHSSGSSGIQSFTYMTKEHQYYLRALQTHWWNWSGFSLGDKVLQFGISQKRSLLKSLKDLFYRVYYHKAFGINDKEFESLANRLKKANINYIAGYPSVINQVALYAKRNSKLNGVICFGDKLFAHHENNIKKAFGDNTLIIDTYGCAEGLLMACRKDIPYYYIMSPHVFIEIVDDNGDPIEDGKQGNVLVTCLTNKAMPLIRYKLGDLGIILPKEDYPKNKLYQYPLLKKIVGRETDIIKTKNGKVLNVHSFTGVFEFYQEIKQYKIIQHNLDSLKVEYISNAVVEESTLTELKSKFLKLTNSDIEIHFKRVKHLAPSKSGKPQIIETSLIN